MRTSRFASLLGCVLLSGTLATACSAEEGEDGGNSSESSQDENKNPDELLRVDFDQPTGYTKDPDLEPLVEFSTQYEATFFQQDGADTDEVVFVVSYLLEDEVSEEHEAQEKVVQGFDEKMSNEDGGIPNIALVNGDQGVFRRAAFESPDDKDKQVNQDNTFLFDGRRMIHVGCQWEEDYQASETACVTVLDSLTYEG